MSVVQKGETVVITDAEVMLGLAWDILGTEVDLDASLVSFDLAGKPLETVYYGNLKAFGGLVEHTGDNRTGEGEGDDEQIRIQLHKLPDKVQAFGLVVTSYSGENFKKVETASCRVVGSANKELYTISIGCVGGHTGLVLGVFFRDMTAQGIVWKFHACAKTAEARTFADLIPVTQEVLKEFMPDVKVDKTYSVPVLRKGERVRLDTNLNQVAIGLGWDFNAGRVVDLDASCLMFDKDANDVDVVFFGKRMSETKAVQHSGDNLTGAGEGDDETIYCFLKSIPANIMSLVFVVTSYKGDKFNAVKTAYVRLLDAEQKEVLRYPLYEFGDNTALIVCGFHRSPGGWKMSALGVPTNGKLYKDCVPEAKKIVQPIHNKIPFDQLNFEVLPVPELSVGRPPAVTLRQPSNGCCAIL